MINYNIDMIKRIYSDLDKYIKKNKVLVILGARQVGKTTLIKEYLKKTHYKYKYFIGDDIRIQKVFSSRDLDYISEYIEDYELIVIDEANRIEHIGDSLKLIIDNIPNKNIIITGSSSFELAGQIGEPLTGRKRTLYLFPLSFYELSKIMNKGELRNQLNNVLRFGLYPEVITTKNRTEKIDILSELVGSYLLKDIFEFEKVKKSKKIIDLLRLLAYQIGNEVSFNELGKQLGIDHKTISRYIDLLEKNYILFNLRGFSKNQRKEITKKSKYYFYDIGIRNAMISNFNNIDERDDAGNIWENFIIIEKLKKNIYCKETSNMFFWRTWQGYEIDLIEEKDGIFDTVEVKWGSSRKRNYFSKFNEIYKNSTSLIVNKQNYFDFII